MKPARQPVADLVESPRRNISALVTLTGANFVIVTTEFVFVGLLPRLSRELGIGTPQAATFISAFALAAAVAGPALALRFRRVNNRLLLITVVALFSGLNVLAALVPTYWVLLAVRVLQGSALPLFISAASVTAANLAENGKRGGAIGFLNYGMAAATVLGVPIGTYLAAALGSWAAFLALAMIGSVSALALAFVLPRSLRGEESTSTVDQLRLLQRPTFLLHLLVSIVGFAALFAGYSYLPTFLHDALHLEGSTLSVALFGFGIVGVLGNWFANRTVDRDPLGGAALAFLIVSAAMATTMMSAGALPVLGVAAGAIWGGAHMASFVFNQVRVISAGSDAPMFAAAMNISACNAGIAAGTAAGGWVSGHFGIVSAGVLGSALAFVAAAVATGLFFVRRTARRRSDQAAAVAGNAVSRRCLH